MKKSILILSALFLLMTACQDGTSPSSGSAVVPSANDPVGEILISGIEAGTENINLSGSMDEGLSLFLKEVPTDGSVTVVSDIPAGDWIFYLNFTNASGDVIGYGTRIVTVPENGQATILCNFGAPIAVPGEAEFQEVLDGWFDAIFNAYGIPGENDSDSNGLLLRDGTSYLFNLLFGSDVLPIEDISICDIVNLNSFLPGGEDSVEKCNEPNPPCDLPYLDQEGWIALYKEIFFTFQLNMLYYHNMLVFDIMSPVLTGIAEGATFESDQTVAMTADVEIGADCADAVDIDILWYLNGFYIGESDDDEPFEVDMSGAPEGTNSLTAAVTYQGYAFGMASVDFTVESGNSDIMTVGSFRDTVNAELGAYLITNGFAEGNDVLSFSGNMHIDGVDLDLTGIYEFANLTSLWLTDTGFTLADAAQLRSVDGTQGLDNLTSVFLTQSGVTIPQNIRDAVEAAVHNPSCLFIYE